MRFAATINSRAVASTALFIAIAAIGTLFYAETSFALVSPYSCRLVTNEGGPPNYVSVARCAPGEFLMGGGGRSEIPGSDLCAGTSRSFMHTNAPTPDMMGWVVDAYSYNWGGEACTEAYAICCRITVHCPDGSIPPQDDITQCADVPVPPICPAGYTYSEGNCVPGGICSWSLASFNLSSIIDTFGNQCQDVPPVCNHGYTIGADDFCHKTVISCPAGETLQGGICVLQPVTSCPAGETLNNGACTSVTCPLKDFCGADGNAYEQELVAGACSDVVTAQCPWGCSAGACNPPPQMTVSFRATPLLVRPGGATTLAWSATNAKSCTVQGTNGDSYSGTSGTQQSSPLTAQTTFTFSCTALPNIQPATLTQSVTVNVVPVFNEQ